MIFVSLLAMSLGCTELARADTGQTRELRSALIERLRPAVKDERVLAAMARMPRHAFVPETSPPAAYGDQAMGIGHGQTISQPTVVGMMSAALDLRGNERVLEIGTGSGYQAAILSLLARDVYSIERLSPLAARARKALTQLGCANVHLQTGDGYKGWPERAPFDRILLTAAPEKVPRALFDQLAPDGILVAPVGAQGAVQRLERHRKHRDGRITVEDLGGVMFVPLVPEDQPK